MVCQLIPIGAVCYGTCLQETGHSTHLARRKYPISWKKRAILFG